MVELFDFSWTTYPKVYALGHAAIADILKDPVIVEEKFDGSQFSWGVFEDGLRCRSRGQVIDLNAPPNMFKEAVDTVRSFSNMPGWTYRAEWFQKPKQVTLAYSRRPEKGLMLFDINAGVETYLPYNEKAQEAARLGLEVAPLLYSGWLVDIQRFRELLDCESHLGGTKIEGVVVKNYARFGRDGKALLGKFVSEGFKEKHAGEWRRANPASGDIINSLILAYRAEPRWRKAVQHLVERGEIEQSPRDIGKIIPEVKADIEQEAQDEIKEMLWQWARKRLLNACVAGVAEWYKEKLLVQQFDNDDARSADGVVKKEG